MQKTLVVQKRIDAIKIGRRMRPLGDLTALRESIESLGLLNPVVVTRQNELVAGRHRVAVCKALGWTSIPTIVLDVDDLHRQLAEIDENLIRNELTVLERAEHLQRRKTIYEQLHPETKVGAWGGGRGGKGTRTKTELAINAKSVQRFDLNTAKKMGVSDRSIRQDLQIANSLTAAQRKALATTDVADRKADLLVLAKEKDHGKRQVLVDRLASGASKNVREAQRDLRRMGRVERLQEAAAGNKALPSTRRYPIIYADPPWRYEHVETDNRAIENQYPTMALDEICALEVADDVATDDAVLFLWATSPKLEEAFAVLRAWGFKYRSCCVWVKDRIGMGYYVRQQHELLLIATRGTPPTPEPANRPSSVIRAKRGGHSEKPTEAYELIEKMYPELPKIELFARSKRKGWDRWGNQA